MSRVGKKPIIIPENVSIQIIKQEVNVQGIYGTLSKEFLSDITFYLQDNNLYIKNVNLDNNKSKSYHGFVKVTIENMIHGVSKGYTKKLNLQGIGFKFQLLENLLLINIGYTHSIKIIIPNYVKVDLDSPTAIKIYGIDKEKVNLFASAVYNIKPPEPYKGKGIFYENQEIIRKAGKTRR